MMMQTNDLTLYRTSDFVPVFSALSELLDGKEDLSEFVCSESNQILARASTLEGAIEDEE